MELFWSRKINKRLQIDRTLDINVIVTHFAAQNRVFDMKKLDFQRRSSSVSSITSRIITNI